MVLCVKMSLSYAIHFSNSEQDIKDTRHMIHKHVQLKDKHVFENPFFWDIEFPRPCVDIPLLLEWWIYKPVSN